MAKYVKCQRKDCLFYGSSDRCIIPPNKNFYVLDNKRCVKACINYVRDINGLSEEGRYNLSKYQKAYSHKGE